MSILQKCSLIVFFPYSVCNHSSSINESVLNDTEVDDHNIQTFENTSLFYVSCFQYLIVAVVFSKGKPFRQPTYRNCMRYWWTPWNLSQSPKRLKMYLCVCVCLCLCLCVSIGPFVLSVASLYFFLLFIMFHSVETIDTYLKVRTANKRKANLQQFPQYLLINACNYQWHLSLHLSS